MKKLEPGSAAAASSTATPVRACQPYKQGRRQGEGFRCAWQTCLEGGEAVEHAGWQVRMDRHAETSWKGASGRGLQSSLPLPPRLLAPRLPSRRSGGGRSRQPGKGPGAACEAASGAQISGGSYSRARHGKPLSHPGLPATSLLDTTKGLPAGPSHRDNASSRLHMLHPFMLLI